MTENLPPILTVGLFVAFGVGFLVGHANGGREGEHFPSNYNPTQAIISESTKACEANVRACYTLLADRLGKEKPAEVAH